MLLMAHRVKLPWFTGSYKASRPYVIYLLAASVTSFLSACCYSLFLTTWPSPTSGSMECPFVRSTFWSLFRIIFRKYAFFLCSWPPTRHSFSLFLSWHLLQITLNIHFLVHSWVFPQNISTTGLYFTHTC